MCDSRWPRETIAIRWIGTGLGIRSAVGGRTGTGTPHPKYVRASVRDVICQRYLLFMAVAVVVVVCFFVRHGGTAVVVGWRGVAWR